MWWPHRQRRLQQTVGVLGETVHFWGKFKAFSQMQPWLKFTIHPFTSAHFIPNLDQLYLICFVFSRFHSGQKSNIVSLFQLYGWNLIFFNFILFHSIAIFFCIFCHCFTSNLSQYFLFSCYLLTHIGNKNSRKFK